MVRTKKRSSCASGSGNVPSYSIGFWVAMTRKGSRSGRVTPSTVTCCSAIASSRADCVFGIARLISSTRTTFAKIGPALNSKSRSRWLKIERPVTSVGCRSGVHWIREGCAPSIDWAMARASTVFAVPGTSSSSTWPPQTRAATTSVICSRFPNTTVSMLSSRRHAISCASACVSIANPESLRRATLPRSLASRAETTKPCRGWVTGRNEERSGRARPRRVPPPRMPGSVARQRPPRRCASPS